MSEIFESKQLAAIVAAISSPAIVVDKMGVIRSANVPADLFFETETVGKHLTVALRAPAILQAVNEANKKGTTARVEHAVLFPTARKLEVNIAALGQDGNGLSVALVILHDLTHEEQIERMRADFVANASHELRTPLASISGFIETMQGSAKNDAKARDSFLKVMKAQADRMALLIDDLLSLSRVEISEHIAPNEQADFTRIVKQACDLLRPLAESQNCALEINLPDAMPVLGDSNQLSQVVHNLIENGIKYAAAGKKIVIEGAIIHNTTKLVVRDFGPGIAPQHVPRLTERFYRVSAQDSRNRGGTGLGLAIAKHIINRHRGRLTIESELGKGSEFTIQIPNKTH